MRLFELGGTGQKVVAADNFRAAGLTAGCSGPVPWLEKPGKATGSFGECAFNFLALTDCVNGKKQVIWIEAIRQLRRELDKGNSA